MPRALLAPLAGAALLLLAGCGGSSRSSEPVSATTTPGRFLGTELSPARAAPPIALHDASGQPVTLQGQRGRYVLVTFIYTHCPDICPLIVSHMRTALALLGPEAKQVQIVAVSTDPRGDNPRTVAAFLRAHGMTGRMDYLIGSRAELGRVWKEWNIVAKPDKAGRDLVEHSAEIYGISADGRLTTLYPANFKPRQLVHDVPLLAKE